MNWNIIIKKYPKSVIHLQKHKKALIETTEEGCGYFVFENDFVLAMYNEILYDFFDKNEIYIDICIAYNNNFTFSIKVKKKWEDNIEQNNEFLKRPETGEAAFIEAFEILEKRLNNP